MMTTSVFTRPLTNTSEVNKNPIIHIVHNYTVRENVLKHVEAVNSFKYEDWKSKAILKINSVADVL